MTFWTNKPVNVEQTIQISNYMNSSYILDLNTLLTKIENEIDNSKIKLDYHIIFGLTDESLKINILNFINKHYNGINDRLSLYYSKELFEYYVTSDTMCILFYPKGKKPNDISVDNMIGFVCGRPQIIYLKDTNSPDSFKQYKNIDVNFLCLVKSLRNLHVSSYIINIITRECLLNYNQTIYCAAYTVNKQLRVTSFSKKQFYHRTINVDNLIETELLNKNYDKDINILKKIWQSFSYEPNFLKDYKFTLLQSENLTSEELQSLTHQLHDLLLNNNKLSYDIFDYKSKDDITKILTNKSFYNFLIINKKTGDLEDFISLYNLTTRNIINNSKSRNGYFYIFMTSKDDYYKSNIIEYISEYCYNNDLLDMITIMNIMETNFDKYKRLKLLRGSSELYYYLYNIKLSEIEPYKNGLITI